MKAFNVAELHFLNLVKLTVQIQVAIHPCDPFLINNRNVAGNSVEKHCFVVMNVKLEVKLGFKKFY